MIANNNGPSTAVNGDFTHVVAEATDSREPIPPVGGRWMFPIQCERGHDWQPVLQIVERERCDFPGYREIGQKCTKCGMTRIPDVSHRWPPPGRVVEGGDWT